MLRVYTQSAENKVLQEIFLLSVQHIYESATGPEPHRVNALETSINFKSIYLK